MAKPDYFLLLDTETTMDSKVADFGAVVCNRKGEIFAQTGCLIFDIYNNTEKHPLFHNEKAGVLWNEASLKRRYKSYNEMLDNGSRSLKSVSAVNRWLERVAGKFNPYLTAYNLAFDVDKCRKTKIDLNMFKQRFCLMQASQDKWGTSKKYREFILENHYFTNPTDKGNMSYKTTAEAMAHFVTGNDNIEPHTALEDVIDFELPILARLVNTTKKEKWLNPKTSSWQNRQVKDWFKAK